MKIGRVREWHPEKGWGVIDSAETPEGCWASSSQVLVAGYKSLEPGQTVELLYEVADQDGYRFRAVEVWPAARRGSGPRRRARGPSGPCPSPARSSP